MDKELKKDLIFTGISVLALLVLFVIILFISGCDSGWTIAGWEVK